jgi:hypothetical protein
MFELSTRLELLTDLESRQDDLILRLEELDRRLEKTLSECLAVRNAENPPHSPLKKGTGPELNAENPEENGSERPACPLFQQAANPQPEAA